MESLLNSHSLALPALKMLIPIFQLWFIVSIITSNEYRAQIALSQCHNILNQRQVNTAMLPFFHGKKMKWCLCLK